MTRSLFGQRWCFVFGPRDCWFLSSGRRPLAPVPTLSDRPPWSASESIRGERTGVSLSRPCGVANSKDAGDGIASTGGRPLVSLPRVFRRRRLQRACARTNECTVQVLGTLCQSCSRAKTESCVE
jgi:hypothetical protein